MNPEPTTTPEATPAQWVRNDHYHCPKCHGQIQCIARYFWGDSQRLGICVSCGELMCENRYSPPTFCDRPDKYPNKQWHES